MNPRGIVIHTAADRGRDTSAKQINVWHIARGFLGIGYHYVVRKDGRIELGRSLSRKGAHLEGANDTIGICCSGHGEYEPLTLEQRRSLIQLCRDLCDKFNWSTSNIVGHHEGPKRFGAKPTTKTCPGKLINMNELRGSIARGY